MTKWDGAQHGDAMAIRFNLFPSVAIRVERTSVSECVSVGLGVLQQDQHLRAGSKHLVCSIQRIFVSIPKILHYQGKT